MYRRGRNEPLARFATLGIGVLQQGGNITERPVAFAHEIFYGSRTRLPVLPFLQPANHRVPQLRKTDPRARLCYFLFFGYNHGRDCYRLLDAEMGRVAYSCDVTWHHPETPWTAPIHAARTVPSRDIYVPMSQSVPVASPSPAPVATPPAPAPAEILPPPPIPTSNSPAPLPPRVSREIEYEGYVEMPGKTRGETRALRDASREYVHRHGLPLDHAAMCQYWRKAKQPTRLFTNMAPPRTRRICRPRMHPICLYPTMCPMWRSRPMQTYGDTPCTRNSMVFCWQVPSRRRRSSN